MIRTQFIRLYPNKQQAEMMAKTAGTARYCYNWGLAKWNEMYERGEVCDQYLLSRLWTKEKPEWARETYSGAQTRAFINLGTAFKMFFKKLKRHPVYHKKGRRDAFYVSNDKVRFKPGLKIHLPNIGDVKMSEELRFNGKRLSYVVIHASKYWYVSVTTDIPVKVEATVKTDHVAVKSPVGVDLGVKHWAATSDGVVLDEPVKLQKLIARKRHYERQLSRKQKGSKNREKARLRLSKAWQRLCDTRRDAVHKFTSQLVKNHDLICCEDLCVKGLGRSIKSIRSAMARGCLGEIRRQLKYKAERYVEIGRFFPSSKQCSNCGHVKENLRLSDRVYHCPFCGAVMDRDFNASVNIMKEGLRVYTEGHSGSACGGCGSV